MLTCKVGEITMSGDYKDDLKFHSFLYSIASVYCESVATLRHIEHADHKLKPTARRLKVQVKMAWAPFEAQGLYIKSKPRERIISDDYEKLICAGLAFEQSYEQWFLPARQLAHRWIGQSESKLTELRAAISEYIKPIAEGAAKPDTQIIIELLEQRLDDAHQLIQNNNNTAERFFRGDVLPDIQEFTPEFFAERHGMTARNVREQMRLWAAKHNYETIVRHGARWRIEDRILARSFDYHLSLNRRNRKKKNLTSVLLPFSDLDKSEADKK